MLETFGRPASRARASPSPSSTTVRTKSLDLDPFPLLYLHACLHACLALSPFVLYVEVDAEHPDLRHAMLNDLFVDLNTDFLLSEDGAESAVLSRPDSHATRCAGQIVSKHNNGICGKGIAPASSLINIRILSSLMTSSMESEAVTKHLKLVDIYNCSWGPADDGKTLDGPSRGVKMAFLRGIREGREGKGAIYLFASGNGGAYNDHCNADGYASAAFAISIGAVDMDRESPLYMEACPAMLAVAPSSSPRKTGIATTDTRGGCTTEHGGTSAAAPIAAGIIALMLEANPDLTWIQVQRLLVMGATPFKTTEEPSAWTKNAAGRWFSDIYGFGLLDAEKLVTMALNAKGSRGGQMEGLNDRPVLLESASTGQGRVLIKSNVPVERISIILDTRTIGYRGETSVHLTSPSGTRFKVMGERPLDKSEHGFTGWSMTCNAFWGEMSLGEWRLDVQGAVLEQWKLVLFAKDPRGGGQGRAGAGRRAGTVGLFRLDPTIRVCACLVGAAHLVHLTCQLNGHQKGVGYS